MAFVLPLVQYEFQVSMSQLHENRFIFEHSIIFF